MSEEPAGPDSTEGAARPLGDEFDRLRQAFNEDVTDILQLDKIRTYPEIVAAATALRDAARLDEKMYASFDGLPPVPDDAQVTEMRGIAEATRTVHKAVGDLYQQAVLQGEIGQRQEAALGLVIGELQSSRDQARRDGRAITKLTWVLVVLTLVLVVDALGVLEWLARLLGLH